MMDKPVLTDLSLQQLTDWVVKQGFPAYRARQIMDWLVKGRQAGEMCNLPADLIAVLETNAIAQPAAITEQHVSRQDGTQKLLFTFPDGHCVEGVLMRYHHGITLCLSTQVGCRMGCAFCASTLGGLLRNLSRGEMASMAYAASRLVKPERVSNIVLMGSGEPMDNYDEVTAFLRMISSMDSLNIGLRHISLSTCGIPDKILALADEGLPVTLSVSLHAPNDDVRRQMMPVARSWPMEQLLDACRIYVQKTGRRVVFEYAMIDGINDAQEHAKELAGKLRGLQAHVNLIPLNDVAERDLRAASAGQVRSFLKTLESLHISATVRRQMGDDIFGACGQLRAQRLKPLFSTHEPGGTE